MSLVCSVYLYSPVCLWQAARFVSFKSTWYSRKKCTYCQKNVKMAIILQHLWLTSVFSLWNNRNWFWFHIIFCFLFLNLKKDFWNFEIILEKTWKWTQVCIRVCLPVVLRCSYYWASLFMSLSIYWQLLNCSSDVQN